MAEENLRTVTPAELKQILIDHQAWLDGRGGRKADLGRVYLRGADLRGASLSRAGLSGVDLHQAYLKEAGLSRADLSRASLRGANLSRADLSQADLSHADLSGANLSGANLGQANLGWANLSGADLSQARLKGASLNKADLRQVNLDRADLDQADLSGANLGWAYLGGANLGQARLRGASLSQSDLRGQNLSGVDLSRADLNRANLNRADLRRASLEGADLSEASLAGADLREANLEEARLTGCLTAGARLAGARLRLDQAEAVRTWVGRPADGRLIRWPEGEGRPTPESYDLLWLLPQQDRPAAWVGTLERAHPGEWELRGVLRRDQPWLQIRIGSADLDRLIAEGLEQAGLLAGLAKVETNLHQLLAAAEPGREAPGEEAGPGDDKSLAQRIARQLEALGPESLDDLKPLLEKAVQTGAAFTWAEAGRLKVLLKESLTRNRPDFAARLGQALGQWSQQAGLHLGLLPLGRLIQEGSSKEGPILLSATGLLAVLAAACFTGPAEP